MSPLYSCLRTFGLSPKAVGLLNLSTFLKERTEFVDSNHVNPSFTSGKLCPRILWRKLLRSRIQVFEEMSNPLTACREIAEKICWTAKKVLWIKECVTFLQ